MIYRCIGPHVELEYRIYDPNCINNIIIIKIYFKYINIFIHNNNNNNNIYIYYLVLTIANFFAMVYGMSRPSSLHSLTKKYFFFFQISPEANVKLYGHQLHVTVLH